MTTHELLDMVGRLLNHIPGDGSREVIQEEILKLSDTVMELTEYKEKMEQAFTMSRSEREAELQAHIDNLTESQAKTEAFLTMSDTARSSHLERELQHARNQISNLKAGFEDLNDKLCKAETRAAELGHDVQTKATYIKNLEEAVKDLREEAKGAWQRHANEFYEQSLKANARIEELESYTRKLEAKVTEFGGLLHDEKTKIKELEASNDKYRQFKDHLPMEDIVAIEIPGEHPQDGDTWEFAVHKSLKRYVESLEAQLSQSAFARSDNLQAECGKLRTDNEVLQTKIDVLTGRFDRSQQINAERHDQLTSLRKILHAVARRALPGTTDLDIHVLFRDDVID